MKNLDLLVPQPPEPRDEFRFGTVTQASPLTVRFDGDTAPTPVATALEPVRVGERVLVLAKKQQRILIGRVGGVDPAGALLYRWPLGALIRTSIPAVEASMWQLELTIHPYGQTADSAGVAWFRGYSNPTDNTMIATGGKSTVGPLTLHAFIFDGMLCFWLSGGGRNYQTLNVSLRTQYGLANHQIVSVTNEGLPSSGMSRTATIEARTLGYQTVEAIELASGITGGCQVEVEDRLASLRGWGVVRSGGWPAGLTTLAVLPTHLCPPLPSALVAMGQFAAKSDLRLLQDGTLQLYCSSATSESALTLGGTWRL